MYNNYIQKIYKALSYSKNMKKKILEEKAMLDLKLEKIIVSEIKKRSSLIVSNRKILGPGEYNDFLNNCDEKGNYFTNENILLHGKKAVFKEVGGSINYEIGFKKYLKIGKPRDLELEITKKYFTFKSKEDIFPLNLRKYFHFKKNI